MIFEAMLIMSAGLIGYHVDDALTQKEQCKAQGMEYKHHETGMGCVDMGKEFRCRVIKGGNYNRKFNRCFKIEFIEP